MKRISRRTFVAGVGGAAIAAYAASRFPVLPKPPTGKPNIILFIADDMRFDAAGFAGNTIVKTPHLDALAERSAIFTNNFVTTSICPTSRASILTGQYAKKHKIYNFIKPLKESALRQAFPTLLKDAGYYTGYIGKWGLGGKLPARAFDDWRGYAGQGKYYGKGKTHLTERQAIQAEEFFKNKPSDRPFALIVAFKAPHGPWQSEKKFKELYQNINIPRFPNDSDEAFKKLPALLRHSYGRRIYDNNFEGDAQYQTFARNYYGLISGLDDAVGKMLAMLGSELDNTAVLFTSDNGLMNGEHGLTGKFIMYESSIRTPMLVHLPGMKNSHKIAATSLNVDIAPTILSIAGLSAPSSMQGSDLLPVIQNKIAALRDGFYYFHPKDPSHRKGRLRHILSCDGYRNEQYKYTRYFRGRKKVDVLFDLKNDPDEMVNLAEKAEYAEVLQTMRNMMKEAKKKVS